jgi:putative FmdB family regulatory protein
MPTYQYACRSCGHRFDTVQGFSEETLRTCPACHQDELRKLFGNVGVVFKGSGFYRNDSRSAAKSNSMSASSPTAEGAKSGAKAEGSKPAEGKTEGSKPAPATQSAAPAKQTTASSA